MEMLDVKRLVAQAVALPAIMPSCHMDACIRTGRLYGHNAKSPFW